MELLLLQRGDVHLVVSCYLQDQPRSMQVFPFLFTELSVSAEHKDSKYQLLLNAVEENIQVSFASDSNKLLRKKFSLSHIYTHYLSVIFRTWLL